MLKGLSTAVCGCVVLPVIDGVDCLDFDLLVGSLRAANDLREGMTFTL